MRLTGQQQPLRPEHAQRRDDEAEAKQQCHGRSSTRAPDSRQGRRDHRRHERQCGHQKARRRLRPAPPHVVPAGARDKEKSRQQKRERQSTPAALAEQEPRPGEGGEIHRAVDEQSELLVDEQAEQAARQIAQPDRQIRRRTIRRGRIRRAVDDVEKSQPGGRRQDDGQENCRGGAAVVPKAQEEECRQRRQQHDELGVQPGQRGKTGASPDPQQVVSGGRPAHGPRQKPEKESVVVQAFRPAVSGRPEGLHYISGRIVTVFRQPSHRPGHDRRRRHLGEERPAERHPRNGQADADPCHQPDGRSAQQRSDIEHRDRSERSEEAHHHDCPSHPSDRVRRKQQHRKTWGVDGIDCAVLAAAQVVGRQLAVEKQPVIRPPVVVLDLHIVVGQHAVGDDQVVRLVAADPDSLQRPQAHTRVESQRRHEDASAAEPGKRRPPPS